MAGEKVRLTHTGPQIDAGIDAALNPDTVPEADSDALITSDAVAKVQQGFAPIENAATAANAYAIGDLLVWGGVLYKAKAAISVGDSFTVGTNIETTTVADKLNNIDSQITTNTDTTIGGLLKGSSGKVAPAVGDTDFATPAAMTATRQMLAPILADPAGQAVSAGDFFIYNGVLRKALQAITSAMTAATFTGATYSEAVSNGGLNELKSAMDVVPKSITQASVSASWEGSLVSIGNLAIFTINMGIKANSIVANTWTKIADLPSDMIPPRVVAGCGVLTDENGNPLGVVRFSIPANGTAVNIKYGNTMSAITNLYANFTYALT